MSCLGGAASGQSLPAPAEEKVEPDRRDFATGTGIVPTGHVQVELGATWERSADERQWTLGDVELRLPVSPRVEARLGLPSYLIQHATPGRNIGFDDASVEARILLRKEPSYAIAVQIGSTIPSGARSVAERRFQPQAVLASTLTLSSTTDLVINIGGTRASYEGQRFNQVFVASSLRFDCSRKLNLFGEVYAFNRDAQNGSSRKYAAAGAVYDLDRFTALDARLIKGVHNGSGTTTAVSAGVSRLF